MFFIFAPLQHRDAAVFFDLIFHLYAEACGDINEVIDCSSVVFDRIRVADLYIVVMVSYECGEFACAVLFIHGVSPFVFVPIQYRKPPKEPSENGPKTHFFYYFFHSF